MPRLIPEAPTFQTTSEELVWERLRDSLGPDDVLLANLRLTDEEKDVEADVVVLMPEVGILVLEVKGGSVHVTPDEADGHAWWIQRQGAHRRIKPVDQVRTAKHALKRYVEQHPDGGLARRVGWGHGVVTPYSAFASDFTVPELPRWALHDRDDLVTLAERVRDNAWGLLHGQRPPTHDDVEAIADILTGRFAAPYDVNAESDDRAATFDRLTMEQATILRVTRLLPRIEVRGGAGSGKTVLALQQAKELTRGGQGRPSQRVALLCYSIGLAEHLKRQVATWDRRHRPAFVGTFHAFGQQWGAADGDRSDSEFWEERLPAEMGELAAALPDGKKYDAVIVDEAQDFADSWWTPVLRSLRDEEEGGLFVYSDENQRIFARFGRPPVALVPLVLDHNLRNTKQIHESFGPLAPSRMYSRGGDGPAVRFVESTPRRRDRCGRRRGGQAARRGLGAAEHRPAHHRPPPPDPGGAHRLPRPGGLLGHVLGRRRLLRPRPRVQGARAASCRAVPQRGRGARSGTRAAVRRDVAGHGRARRGWRSRPRFGGSVGTRSPRRLGL